MKEIFFNVMWGGAIAVVGALAVAVVTAIVGTIIDMVKDIIKGNW